MFGSDDHEESADRKAFGFGLVLGAIVGASAALLLAPATGEQTRRKIRRGARRVYLQGNEMAGDVWTDADRHTRQLRKEASRKLKRGMKRGSSYIDDAADLVESGRRRLGWR